jgi:hypothetical protein
MSHSQILDTGATRPPLRRRIAAHAAVCAARLLAHLPPRRLRAVLHIARRGAAPASYALALQARQDVTAVGTLCAGRYCLHRSLATALLCRIGGTWPTWPTWCTGVRTSPFAAHAWVEAQGAASANPGTPPPTEPCSPSRPADHARTQQPPPPSGSAMTGAASRAWG